MKSSIIKLVVLLAFAASYMVACDNPSSVNSSQDQNISSMEDLKVPSNFDWKTQKDVTVKLTGYVTGRVQLLSPEGDVYHQAILTDSNQYEVKLTVPAYVDFIEVRYRSQSTELDLDRSVLSHTFVAN